MSQITYRQLDSNYDPIYGQGQANFLVDANAVAQAVQTRLLMFEGEWWENKLDGLPLWQNILGQSGSLANQNLICDLIVDRIEGTPFVTQVQNVSFAYNASTRAFKFNCQAVTSFGPIISVNLPATDNQQGV